MSDEHGRRLLCSVLHNEARHNPNRLFAIVAKTNDIADGYHHISFAQISRATNYVTTWLRNRFEHGANPTPQTTLAYIGVPDIRYNIIFYAAVQCRYKLFVPSPRNVPALNTSLLVATECSRLVYAQEVNSVVKQLQSDSPKLDCELFPAIADLLDVPDTPYSYDFQYSQISEEPILVLHSSGSTGLPKPIIWNHGSIAALDYRDWPVVKGRRNHDFAASLTFSKNEGRLLDFFPPFHAGGVMFKILTPIWNLTVPIFGPALRPPSGSLAAQIMRELRPDGIVLPPSICEQLVQEHDSEQLFTSLVFLMYGGGPMAKAAGEMITSWTTVIQAFACTETPHIRQLVTQPEDWEYVEFHPNERVDLQPRDDGLYEMVFRIRPEYERDLVLYHNFPHLSTWNSRDLFTRHPTKPNLYKFHGRLDDIIVFSSGEKLYPLPMEIALTDVPGVNGALLVGQGHPQAALLVELNSDASTAPGMNQDLWAAVETANALMPAHGRVSRDMVIIADTQRPFQRAAKGSVIRKLTEELYSRDIENLFARKASLQGMAVATFNPSAYRLEDIKLVLRSILRNVSIDQQLSDVDNFYTYGMNSIKTAEAVNYTKSSLLASMPGINLDWLSMEVFYEYPSISGLASVLLSFLNDGRMPVRPNRIQQMEAKLEQYTRDLPKRPTNLQNGAKKDQFSIAITGTTGFFGPYLLDTLLHTPCISRIYCLNRSCIALKNLNLDDSSSVLGTKLVFMQCDFAKQRLGLTDEDYSRLLDDCDLILHNAWRVDFNLPLNSFHDNLESIRQLVTLSALAVSRPRIVFVSTIAATGVRSADGQTSEVLPEQSIQAMDVSVPMGYAESKRVAERTLEIASTQTGVPITVIRLGHLVPNEEGVLSDNDFLTAFLRSCKGLGLLAVDFIDAVNWLKVNDAARIVGEVIKHGLHEPLSDPSYFNLVNPTEKQWSEYVDAIGSWSGKTLKHVTMQDWVSALKQQRSTDVITMKRLPALRMLPMMDVWSQGRFVQKYEQSALRAISPTVGSLAAISIPTFESWLRKL